MAVEGVFFDATRILAELGRIGLVLQALGVVVLFWIIFQIVAVIVGRKKLRALYNVREDMIRLEAKIDRLLRKLDIEEKNRK